MTVSAMLTLLVQGFGKSLEIFTLTLLGSLPLGLLVMFGRRSRVAPLRWLVKLFISVMRGTPLMLQLMVVYYGPFLLFDFTPPGNWRFGAVIVGFVINYAAYFAEIYRAGYESIPVGQFEAAQVLGRLRESDIAMPIVADIHFDYRPAIAAGRPSGASFFPR